MARKKHPEEKRETPLNELPGRCKNCANGTFTLHLHEKILYRECICCGEVFDVDHMILKRKGDEQLAWKPA
ncbi:hypothetical protein [Brevibacillus sp. H7]|uniref:hypothetical protein n=1 Tax=Brevibacillus sp. H7 TaxID=3349138 RepID=UPI003816E30F